MPKPPLSHLDSKKAFFDHKNASRARDPNRDTTRDLNHSAIRTVHVSKKAVLKYV